MKEKALSTYHLIFLITSHISVSVMCEIKLTNALL